jgi:hemolysin D
MSNRDIFVHQGQQAKVDTFAFTRYGLLHGKVLSVSPDAITHNNPEEETGAVQGAESSTSDPRDRSSSTLPVSRSTARRCRSTAWST